MDKCDILIVIGLSGLGTGLYIRFGIGEALITVSSVLLLFGVKLAFK